jgi:hypothetical protein
MTPKTLAPDLDWMDWAEQHRPIRLNTRETLLSNSLVPTAPADEKAEFKMAVDKLGLKRGDKVFALVKTVAFDERNLAPMRCATSPAV